MSKQRAILHVGLHKTGSTAIQESAFLNRGLLLESGLYYPDYTPVWKKDVRAHHAFAHSLSDAGGRFSGSDLLLLVERWHQFCRNTGSSLFLSSESWSRHRDASFSDDWFSQRGSYLKRLRTLLGGFNVTVVLVLRRQDFYTKALYKEYVMKGTPRGSVGFPEFIDACKTRVLRFFDSIRMYQSTFDEIVILTYEDLCENGSLVRSFFERIGVECVSFLDVGKVRESLSDVESVLKCRLNQVYGAGCRNADMLRWLKCDATKEAIDMLMCGRRFDYWNVENRPGFLSLFEKENRDIAQTCFDRDCLFAEVVGAQENDITIGEILDSLIPADVESMFVRCEEQRPDLDF